MDTIEDFITTLKEVVEVYIIIVGLVEYVDNVVQLPTILLLELSKYIDVVLTNNSGTLLDY